MSNVSLFKVNNGFEVKKFITQIDVDFVYSTDHSEETFLLLNQSAFGEFTKTDIEKQISNNLKVIILNNDTLEMKAYNTDEQEIINAFMNMG